MATKFVSSGHLLRRERSFDNISFEAKVVGVDREIADGISGIMRAIDRFDREKQIALKELAEEVKKEAKKAGEDNAIGQAGVRSTNFTSLMHNAIDQGLLAQKAEATVQEAIAALERGEKPLIALASTMDSFIKSHVDDQELKPEDSIDISFGDVLNRYLERSRDIVVSDYEGVRDRRPMTEDELGPAAMDAFMEAKELLAQTDLSGIPLSTIDYIRHRLTEEGYRVNEITGRSSMVEYDPNGAMTYKVRPSKEITPQGKIEVVNKFNNGELDVVILNRSGATGINLHASEKFSDQSLRHMIVVQAERDINQVMQMLGRANRFGQVIEPKFTLLMGDVPAEKRLGALLVNKMASLNANTTAARNSDLSVSNVTDFMNAAGEEVVTELLEENPELEAMLSFPSKGIQSNSGIELISRVTGRIPLLPIQDQEELYQLIETETRSLIEQKAAMGENVLEADKLELDARTIARMEVIPDDSQIKSEFTGPAYLEVVDAKLIDKPMTQLQVINQVRESLELAPITNLIDHDVEQTEAIALERVQERIAAVTEAAKAYGERAQARMVTPEARAKLDARLTQQMEHFAKTVRDFPEGTPVQLRTAEGRVVYGVVGRVWEKNNIKGSPAASTNWKIQFLTDNRAKLITVPFSKINLDKETAIRVSKQEARWDGTSIYDSFDLKQSDRRSEMQLVTGNLLKAYEKFPKGKFVNFTDNRGNVRQGLIMPDDFNIQEELSKEPVVFRTPQQVKEFITEVTANLGAVQDLERNLTIRVKGVGRFNGEQPSEFVVQTAKATSVGGKYFLDEDLMRAGGDEFYSVSDRMEMTIPAEKLDAVLDVLMNDKDIKLAAFDYKDLARKQIGELIPQMELIESNQFAEQGDYVPYVPEPTPAIVQQLEVLLEQPAPESEAQSTVDQDQAIARGEGQPEAISGAESQSSDIPALDEELPVQPGLMAEPTAPSDPQETIELDIPIAQPVPQLNGIAPPEQQAGDAERYVAQLLHESGIAESLLEGETFFLHVKNGENNPLDIERRGNDLALTQYGESAGKRTLDSELVFNISQSGNLTFKEVAAHDPIQGQEVRSQSVPYARLYAKNLLRQNFTEAIAQAVAVRATQTTPSTPVVAEPPQMDTSRLDTWQKAMTALNRPEDYRAWVNQNIETIKATGIIPQQAEVLMSKDLASHEAGLNKIRGWYKTAMQLGKSQQYLDRIQATGQNFKEGQPLNEKAIAALHNDQAQSHYNRYSAGVPKTSPQEFSTHVAANAIAGGLDHHDILRMMEHDPVYKHLLSHQGEQAAQTHAKRSVVAGRGMAHIQTQQRAIAQQEIRQRGRAL